MGVRPDCSLHVCYLFSFSVQKMVRTTTYEIVVPWTCCVLTNNDPEKPEPVNRMLCQQEAAFNDPQNGTNYHPQVGRVSHAANASFPSSCHPVCEGFRKTRAPQKHEKGVREENPVLCGISCAHTRMQCLFLQKSSGQLSSPTECNSVNPAHGSVSRFFELKPCKEDALF